MSKPSAAEPSMEDILASIRKMISEERLGPRPLPDQMSRTPFGEMASAKAAEPEVFQAEPEPAPEPEPETRPAPAAGTQPVPSFSSLSDALKAASKPSIQHRSLDEKIADMLDKGPAPAAPVHPVAVDPLAVFAATRPARSTPAQSNPKSTDAPAGTRTPARSIEPISPVLKPGADKLTARDDATSAPARGATPATPYALDGPLPPLQESKASDLGTVVPLSGDMPSARRAGVPQRPASGSVAVDKAASGADAEAKGPEDRTVISIPSRSMPGAAQTGTAPKSGAINGASISRFGPRSLPGATGLVRTEDAGKAGGVPYEDPHETRRSSFEDVPLKDATQPGRASLEDMSLQDDEASAPSLEDIAKATLPDDTVPADAIVEPPKAAMSFDFLGGAPSTEETTAEEADTVDVRDEGVPSTAADLLAKLVPSALPDLAAPTGAFAGTSDEVPAEPAEAGTHYVAPAAEDAAPAQPFSSLPAKARSAPSEALLDAVVDMVHSEPSSLSVFASGSAFINGVSSASSMADKPKDPRKLDRAAAELLRPMLRQWLAENMPRIVEEALRSELDGTQHPDDKDADKS